MSIIIRKNNMNKNSNNMANKITKYSGTKLIKDDSKVVLS